VAPKDHFYLAEQQQQQQQQQNTHFITKISGDTLDYKKNIIGTHNHGLLPTLTLSV